MKAAKTVKKIGRCGKMVTIEQIDEFRKRTNSSYADAKYFLEKNDGDILEAIIDFEKAKTEKTQNFQQKKSQNNFGKHFADILQKGFDTRIYIEDKNSTLFTIPVNFLILLLPIWIIALLFFIFLYMLGYKFSIHEVKNQNINVNSFFQNINDKLKESENKKKSQSSSMDKSSDQDQAANKSQVPVVSNITPPVKTEAPIPEAEPDKDKGYKEYTVE